MLDGTCFSYVIGVVSCIVDFTTTFMPILSGSHSTRKVKMAESIENLAQIDEYNEYRAYEKINHTPVKKELYRSIYSDKVRKEDQEYKEKWNGHSTYGLAPGSYKPVPTDWLKKDTFRKELPEMKKFEYTDRRKP